MARSAQAVLLLGASAAALPAQQPIAAAVTPIAAAGALHIALRYEVPASAVAAALTTEGLLIAPDRLHLAMPLSAASPAPQLHVAGAQLEHDGSLRLRIICRKAGECMPFFATVAKSDSETALAAITGLHPAATAPVAGTALGSGSPLAVAGNAASPASGSAGPVSLTAAAARPQGITVGARITLQLTDAQMRIQLPAVAMDTGAPGTEVRVTSADHRHTYRGVVIDADTVKGVL